MQKIPYRYCEFFPSLEIGDKFRLLGQTFVKSGEFTIKGPEHEIFINPRIFKSFAGVRSHIKDAVKNQPDKISLAEALFQINNMEKSEWKPDYAVTPRRVVCAANRNRLTGRIVCGARHWDKVMRSQKLESESWNGWDQGFIDQFGDWMDRKTAWNIAKEQNQIRREVSVEGTLYSENLY